MVCFEEKDYSSRSECVYGGRACLSRVVAAQSEREVARKKDGRRRE